MDEKKRLRRVVRASLMGLPPERGRSVGARIAESLEADRAFEGCSEVVLFASLSGEPDTRPIFEAARAAGLRCLLPRMIAGPDLEFARVDDFGSLVVGRYGVREPARSSEASEVGGRSLVLVPGLAFDRRGGRLGRGAGYYDRALARVRRGEGTSRIVGVGFDVQIVECVPMDDHDVRLDGIVTDAGLVWAKPLRAGPVGLFEQDTFEQGNAENDD